MSELLTVPRARITTRERPSDYFELSLLKAFLSTCPGFPGRGERVIRHCNAVKSYGGALNAKTARNYVKH